MQASEASIVLHVGPIFPGKVESPSQLVQCFAG